MNNERLLKAKNDLAKISDLTIGCSQKAMVLSMCNSVAAQDGGFSGVSGLSDCDIMHLHNGLSRIAYEIADDATEANFLILDLETYIDQCIKSLR